MSRAKNQVLAFTGVIHLIGGISKGIAGWFQFPALLQYPPHLMSLRFDIRVCQQRENVGIAKRESVCTCACHDVKDKLVHLYFQSVTVASDYLLQGFGMQQIIEGSRYIRFQLLQKVGIIRL